MSNRTREHERFVEPEGDPLWLRAAPGIDSVLAEDEVLSALREVLAAPETVTELAEAEREERYPAGVVARLQEAGLWKLYTGERATAFHQAAVCALAAQRDGGLAITLGVNSLALLAPALGASDEQLAEIEGRVGDGVLCGLLLTELDPGSNLIEIEARAEPGVLEGGRFRPVDEASATHYRLSGSKELINGGQRHGLLFAFLRTQPKGSDRLMGHTSHGMFVVERGPGVRALERWRTLPARAADISGVAFEDVIIPASQRLGPAGGGFDLAKRTLAISRGGISALASGAASRAKALALAYARKRSIYGKPIAELGAIAEHLARLDAWERIASAASLRAIAWVNSAGRKAAPYTAVAKLIACAAAEEAVDEGRRVLGGRALLSELPYERLIRDVLLYPVFDGTSHLMLEDLQMRLSMQARRAAEAADTVSAVRGVYGTAPRPLRQALSSGGLRTLPVVQHAANLAQQGGCDLTPLAQVAQALIGLTKALKAARRWGDDQALRHDMAWAYAELEALFALVELFDPERRALFVRPELNQAADGPGYRHALGLLGGRLCARLAARVAKAGVADEWDLPSLRRSFLLDGDGQRRALIQALVD